MKHPKLYVIAGLGFVFIGAGLFAIVYSRTRDPIPRAIKSQTSYVIFYPGEGSGLKVDTASFKFEPKEKVLSYTATVQRQNVSATITEQATPPSFMDIASAYSTFVTSLAGYSSFGSSVGSVSLTRPPNLNGDQAAVINQQGTMLFVHPQKDLSQSTWQQLFNNLTTIK